MTLPDAQKPFTWWVISGIIGVLGMLTVVFAGMVWANNTSAIADVREQARSAISDVRTESRTGMAELHGDYKGLNQKVIALEISITKLENKVESRIQNLETRIQSLVDAINQRIVIDGGDDRAPAIRGKR